MMNMIIMSTNSSNSTSHRRHRSTLLSSTFLMAAACCLLQNHVVGGRLYETTTLDHEDMAQTQARGQEGYDVQENENEEDSMPDRKLPSFKWYVDWEHHQCVQNCNTDNSSSCGGRVRLPRKELFDSSQSCCAEMLSYLPLQECMKREEENKVPSSARAYKSTTSDPNKCPDEKYDSSTTYAAFDTVVFWNKVYQCKSGAVWQYCNMFPPNYTVHAAGGSTVVHQTKDELGWMLLGDCNDDDDNGSDGSNYDGVEKEDGYESEGYPSITAPRNGGNNNSNTRDRNDRNKNRKRNKQQQASSSTTEGGLFLVLRATDDVYIDRQDDNENYNEVTLQYNHGTVETLVRFDLSDLHNDQQDISLDEATMQLYPLEQCHGRMNIEVLTGNDWSEEQVTWSTAPHKTGPKSAQPPQSVGNQYPVKNEWFDVEVTNAVLWSMQVQQQSYVTFRLSSTADEDDASCVLASREYRKGKYAPILKLRLTGNNNKGGRDGLRPNREPRPQKKINKQQTPDKPSSSSRPKQSSSISERGKSTNTKSSQIKSREPKLRPSKLNKPRNNDILSSVVGTRSDGGEDNDIYSDKILLQREGDSCVIERYLDGYEECISGLKCYHPDGHTSGFGTCRRIVKFARKSQPCDASFGVNACDEAGCSCMGANGFKLKRDVVGSGTCICKTLSGREGNSCEIERYLDGYEECGGGLVCYDHDGATYGAGICTQVDKFARENQACDASFGADACDDADFECLGANGYELRGVGTTGICSISLRRKGDSCQIERYLDGYKECVNGLVCYDSDGATNGTGICTQVDKFARENQACDASFGADSCDDTEYACLGSNGYELRGVGTTGICSLSPRRDGDSCQIERYLNGKRECANGLVCYDPDGATFGTGICTQVDKFARENQACDASFGADACDCAACECLGSNGFELGGVGTGICTSEAPQQGATYTTFREKTNQEEWFVDYSLGSEGQCVMSCDEFQGRHCGGRATKWEEMFSTAEVCCEQKLWWMNRSQCAPGL